MTEKGHEYNVTKGKILKTAYQVIEGVKGGFISTDSNWCECVTPEAFTKMLETRYGFRVVECKEADMTSARAVTEEGLVIYYSGFCTTKR